MFYDKLLALCVERDISPSAAAEAVGMTGAHVTRWKNGSVPQDMTIQKFAKYFDVPVKYFREETKPLAQMSKELQECLEILRDRPETRALLHAGKNMTPEQVAKMAEFMQSMKGDGNAD